METRHTNIRHVSADCWIGFQGERLEVKGDSETKCTFAAEAYISAVWRRGALVDSILRLKFLPEWMTLYLTSFNNL